MKFHHFGKNILNNKKIKKNLLKGKKMCYNKRKERRREYEKIVLFFIVVFLSISISGCKKIKTILNQ